MNLIEKLSDKDYIKKLNNRNSSLVCSEIRRFLVENVMKTGGHLASNLGVVELTIAMHKVFDFPKDKVVFDVGHQSYVHKILSGRCNSFSTLRQLDGMSGFPKREESEYDCFDTGHSSTSISAALGIAKARDLNNDKFNVIAFIGDGALGGGMAFEAMNDAGASETKIIIILNDNEMSISKNVGGLSAHLSMLRLDKGYINAKTRMHKLLNKTGTVGNKITKFIKDTKNAIKYAAIEVPMFEDLGITYIGIIDGHNIDDLSDALEKAKHINGPVLIHTFTVKGRGYAPAEKNPDIFHGVSPANNTDDISLKKQITYSELFGKYICCKAEKNKNIAAITAAMRSGCGLTKFSELYPNRFYDVGIAEQHAVTFAGGLATQGIIPVFSVYSTFLQRAYDQILHDICLQNLHVVFAVDRAGIVGNDGETHQGIFDFSYLLHIPNITVLAPTCEKDFIQMFDYAIDKVGGPVAIRYPRENISVRDCDDFKPDKFEMTDYHDNKILIIGIGRMYNCAVQTMNILKKDGYDAGVVGVKKIKPIDAKMLDSIVGKCTAVITIEDNEITGGAGEYLMSQTNRHNRSKFINVGCDDCFVKQGTPAELFERYGINAKNISNMIKKELSDNEKQTRY